MPSTRVLAAALYRSKPKSRASEVLSMTSSSVTSWARIRLGSTCTCTALMRSPHIGTLATPGTDIRRNLIVQYAIIDRSIMSKVFDVRPIFMTRLVDESGCSMIGMPEDCGRSANAMLRGSCTRCRAHLRSVPGLERGTTEDRAAPDG